MFEFKENRRNISEHEILEDIKRVANLLQSNTLTKPLYEKHGNYGFTTIRRKFGKWSTALDKCNLKVKVPIYNSDEDLFINLANVWTKLGKQPSSKKLSKKASKFSVGTYEKRFGSWNNALKAFIEYIKNNNINVLPVDRPQTEVTSSNKTPRDINWRLRAKILIRDNCICQMCGASPAKDADVVLHVDHIYPYSKGGETVEENLRTLCSQCNIGKSDMVVEDITEK